MVALEAWESERKVKWVDDLKDGLEKFGWSSEVVEKLEGVSGSEVKQMLRDCAWREVKEAWMAEAQGRPKLGVMKSLMEGGCDERCMQVARKGFRRILAKLRGGTAELRVETGRWVGMRREERICVQCCLGEVENVEHFILRCE